jgi:hypothetical protein
MQYRRLDPVGEALKPFATGPGRAISRQRKNRMAKAHKSRSKSRAKQNHRAKLKPQDCTLGLQVVNPKAAGIDVGHDEHWVAVPPDLDPEPVRRFGSFTSDLLEMADWLVRCGIETAVMQSTEVHGTALYDILAERGIRLSLSCPFRFLHTFLPLPGQRGITPAFGYSAPHSSAGGTSTLPINALRSAHYGVCRLLLRSHGENLPR